MLKMAYRTGYPIKEWDDVICVGDMVEKCGLIPQEHGQHDREENRKRKESPNAESHPADWHSPQKARISRMNRDMEGV